MDQYLIYLRKSRQDQDKELQTGNFDTLQRHRDALLALAKQHGYTIAYIFEEVVSGDTIAERPEMQKLLAAVETGEYAGVLVMEVPRLARGNTRDQGTVAETFQYSETKIITPDKIYDPSDEADEEYFEFGLFMSRREYKAINRRLQRGRMASLNEGKYIAGTAPYGYCKVKIPHQRGYTLEIDPTQAETVHEIFRLYTVGDPQPDGTTEPIGSTGIANLLNARGVLSPGGIKWTATAVRDIIKNPTYAGYLRWSYRPVKKQMVDGKVVITAPVNQDMPLRKGVHPPIISEDTWAAARSVISSRSHAPVPNNKQLTNPLAGLVYCSTCGRSMVQIHKKGKSPMLICPTAKCPTVSSLRSVVESTLLGCLQDWLRGYRIQLPEPSNTDDSGIKAAERNLAKANRDLAALQKQKGSLYDLLEQGTYTQEVFLERSRVLAGRTAEAEANIKALSAHLSAIREAENTRKSMVPRIKHVLELYPALDSPDEKNALLRTVLDHAIYSKTVGGRYQESDMRLYVFPKIVGPKSHL
ncbi:recombinase family protein [Oscillibacter ruminantium]|uniref:recombinase family protein n=1 Tax=Oscillibacter ruminantium TaxID=1263547 RepID=UPI0002D76533|nr:recombinase family protein [Oscillibacter ruminantium]